MADITGTELEKTQALAPELLGDEAVQESVIMVPKSRTDSATLSPSQGESISWMFGGGQTLTDPSARDSEIRDAIVHGQASWRHLPPESARRKQMEEAHRRNQRQMGGTPVPKIMNYDGRDGKWVTADQMRQQQMPNLEEVLDRHKMRYASDSDSEEDFGPGYTRKTENEMIKLLREQLAEQRKLAEIAKAQTEMLANIYTCFRGTYGLLHNMYRIQLIQNGNLEKVDLKLDDMLYLLGGTYPEATDKKATQAEMEAEARRMAAQAAISANAATSKGDDGIPVLAPGVNFEALESQKKRKPPAPPSAGSEGFSNKYV